MAKSCGGALKLNYEAVWKLMADLVAELRKVGESVPAEVMRDLRSAKIMIEILKVDRSRLENVQRIEEYLSNVESYLLSAARRKFGERYAEDWMEKVVEAQKSVQLFEKEPSLKFPVGVQRDRRWVRVKPSTEIPTSRIKQLSEKIGLEVRTQENGLVLVYGEESKVKRFIDELAQLFRKGGGLPSIMARNP